MKTKQYAYNTTGDTIRPLQNIAVGMPYADDRGDTLYPLIDRRNGRTVGYTFDAGLADDIASADEKRETVADAGLKIVDLTCAIETLKTDLEYWESCLYETGADTDHIGAKMREVLARMTGYLTDIIKIGEGIAYDELKNEKEN